MYCLTILYVFIISFHTISSSQAYKPITFASLDTNNDKQLSPDELKVFMNLAEQHTTKIESERILRDHDNDADNLLSIDEYKEYVTSVEKDMNDSITLAIFRIADNDHDGKLSVTELASVVHPKHGSEISRLLTRQHFMSLDTNSDGVISIDEYYENDPDINEEDQKHFESELDRDQDGSVSFSEFSHLHDSEERNDQRSWIDHVLELADKNKDGKIDASEFEKNEELFTNLVDVADYDDDNDEL